MNNTHPKFAVVGHPNKGKSSIVSSLAMDDSVQISDIPGTTTKSRSFPLIVDGKILYELLDTPGFQRARYVLSWFKKHDVGLSKRYKVVEDFINEHQNSEKFNDDIELLKAIAGGAAIIYVVDGSKPYGEEYETQMEILRWTGEPSMALINHIGDKDYSLEWKRALGHYFKLVRSYNPMEATPKEHILVLDSMAHLKEEWTSSIKDAIALYDSYHKEMIKQSATNIAELISRSVGYVDTLKIEDSKAKESEKEQLQKSYKERLRLLEDKTQKKIEKIWNHDNLKKEQTLLEFNGVDLFSEEAESIFGLTRKELLLAGVSSGAIAGSTMDLLFLGHTFFVGGAIGAVVGGVGAYLGFDELSETKVLGTKLGKRYLEIGPMKNINFPYILLGRAIFHTYHIAILSHAKREDITLSMDNSFKDKWLDEKLHKSLEKYHKKFRTTNKATIEDLEAYRDLIIGALEGLI